MLEVEQWFRLLLAALIIPDWWMPGYNRIQPPRCKMLTGRCWPKGDVRALPILYL